VQLLKQARRRRGRDDLDRRRERSIVAAIRLGEGARWTELGAELDVDLLLGEVLADRTRRWVSFEGEGLSVAIPRHLIPATASVARQHLDLAAYVDEHGLHFRWRGGRGRYNWRPHVPRPGLEAHVLTVPLAPKVVPVVVPENRVLGLRREVVPPEGLSDVTAANDMACAEPNTIPAVVPAITAVPVRKGGAWLRDILRELGYF